MEKKIILLADSGSTKTTWYLDQGEETKTLQTEGLSPYFYTQEEIEEILTGTLDLKEVGKAVTQIYYYGTGLSNPEKAEMVERALKAVFKDAEVEINHDLTGAARALCLHRPGIACILGTGSGACYYDGKEIRKSALGLGFILGDEGSGAYLGKLLIQSRLYEKLGKNLSEKFDQRYDLSKIDILHRVYQGKNPNRFLASFAPFLTENRKDKVIQSIIKIGIGDFLDKHVLSFEESKRYPISFVGGIAAAFSEEIGAMCGERELQLGRILKDPMLGLKEYHGL